MTSEERDPDQEAPQSEQPTLGPKVAILAFRTVEINLPSTAPRAERMPHAPPEEVKSVDVKWAAPALGERSDWATWPETKADWERAWNHLLDLTPGGGGRFAEVQVVDPPLALAVREREHPTPTPYFVFHEWHRETAQRESYAGIVPGLEPDNDCRPGAKASSANWKSPAVQRWKLTSKATTFGPDYEEVASQPSLPDADFLVVDSLPVGLTSSVAWIVREHRRRSTVIVAFRAAEVPDASAVQRGEQRQTRPRTLPEALCELTNHLLPTEENRDRPVWLVASDRELVQAGGFERRPLSWRELREWLRDTGLRRSLAECRVSLLLHFASAGVAVLDAARGEHCEPRIFAWPNVLPGEPPEWSFGVVPGVARVWIAALVRTLQSGDEPVWHAFARAGLLDARLHDTFGMQLVPARNRLELPTELIRDLRGSASSLAEQVVELAEAKGEEVLGELAAGIEKPSHRWRWFVKRFGKAEIPDLGNEVSSILAVRQQLDTYAMETRRNKPLNLLIVGPPGGGKSFLVKNLIDSTPGLKGQTETHTVNLTQIASEQEIFPAFEFARTKRVEGKIGVLFFDEFDTARAGQKLGWLSYFLAPMNDGEYASESGTRLFGRSILVFAGGTVQSSQELEESAGDDSKKLKVPDFLSRFHAVHQVRQFDTETDPTVKRVRLAMLLRAQFRETWPSVRKVEDPLLLRLLEANYRHGARSVAAIVAALQGHGKVRLGLDHLPPPAVLNLHLERGSDDP
ncbi:MAG: AAA family ATPase [Sandaracinaceae bacterium]|nr:AAA family ATPase [Sandaracinaceae bacterium]